MIETKKDIGAFGAKMKALNEKKGDDNKDSAGTSLPPVSEKLDNYRKGFLKEQRGFVKTTVKFDKNSRFIDQKGKVYSLSDSCLKNSTQSELRDYLLHNKLIHDTIHSQDHSLASTTVEISNRDIGLHQLQMQVQREYEEMLAREKSREKLEHMAEQRRIMSR